MAGHLAKAGLTMSAYDADPAAIERLRDIHPSIDAADSAAAVGAASDIVLTMLPDGEVVQKVALGPGGLRRRWLPDRCCSIRRRHNHGSPWPLPKPCRNGGSA